MVQPYLANIGMQIDDDHTDDKLNAEHLNGDDDEQDEVPCPPQHGHRTRRVPSPPRPRSLLQLTEKFLRKEGDYLECWQLAR